MSFDSHNPQYTHWLAAQLLVKLGLSPDESALQEIVETLEGYACHAAQIVHWEDNVYKIPNMIWYKSDGWDHGGSAISWQEHAENLELENKELAQKLEGVQEIIRQELI